MASLKARIESRLGVRLSERFWACLVKEFGENPSDYDGQDDYEEELFEYCRRMLELCVLWRDEDAQHAQPTPSRRPASRGPYAKSFRKRWALHLFVQGERIQQNPWYQELFGDSEPAPALTWPRLYALYKAAKDPETGLPYEYVPPTVQAFRQEYLRADRELGQLTVEDLFDMSLQGWFDASDWLAGRRRTASLSDSFQVIRRKRNGEQPAWRGLSAQGFCRLLDEFLAGADSSLGQESHLPEPAQTAEEQEPPPLSVESDPGTEGPDKA